MTALLRLSEHWAPYVPSPDAPWNRRRVVHLHRRAAFGATWREIQRDLEEGPEASVHRLLLGTARLDGVPPGFEATVKLLGQAAIATRDASRLKAWWIYRMLFTPDGLGEKLTLLWHNHFATSQLKVNDLAAMRQQNETFRRLGRGSFRDLIHALMRDPALLLWLDAPANRKGRPNENLGREFLELFTLGVGNYSEVDVKEAARALTGWGLSEDGTFEEASGNHDDGDKTLLGRTGRWSGLDLIRLALDHPATARRLAARLTTLFLAEGVVSSEALTVLAEGLRANGLNVAWGVETILRSRLFYSEANLGKQLTSPVDMVVWAARVLEMTAPPPSTLLLADWATRLGQDLFYPPNVGGWPGGRTWLTSQTALGRVNFASALVQGKGIGRPKPLDAESLAVRHHVQDIQKFYLELLLGIEPTPYWRDLLAGLDAPRTVLRILSSPEAQLA